jgi:hypothetical protein
MPKRNECSRCRLFENYGVDGQIFSDNQYGLTYDVSKARAILQVSPREPIEIPGGKAYEIILQADIHKEHSKHVDIKYPSIAVRHNGKFVIIDGNHRAFQRLCKLLPVKVYLLTAREKRAILNRK